MDTKKASAYAEQHQLGSALSSSAFTKPENHATGVEDSTLQAHQPLDIQTQSQLHARIAALETELRFVKQSHDAANSANQYLLQSISASHATLPFVHSSSNNATTKLETELHDAKDRALKLESQIVDTKKENLILRAKLNRVLRRHIESSRSPSARLKAAVRFWQRKIEAAPSPRKPAPAGGDPVNLLDDEVGSGEVSSQNDSRLYETTSISLLDSDAIEVGPASNARGAAGHSTRVDVDYEIEDALEWQSPESRATGNVTAKALEIPLHNRPGLPASLSKKPEHTAEQHSITPQPLVITTDELLTFSPRLQALSTINVSSKGATENQPDDNDSWKSESSFQPSPQPKEEHNKGVLGVRTFQQHEMTPKCLICGLTFSHREDFGSHVRASACRGNKAAIANNDVSRAPGSLVATKSGSSPQEEVGMHSSAWAPEPFHQSSKAIEIASILPNHDEKGSSPAARVAAFNPNAQPFAPFSHLAHRADAFTWQLSSLPNTFRNTPGFPARDAHREDFSQGAFGPRRPGVPSFWEYGLFFNPLSSAYSEPSSPYDMSTGGDLTKGTMLQLPPWATENQQADPSKVGWGTHYLPPPFPRISPPPLSCRAEFTKPSEHHRTVVVTDLPNSITARDLCLRVGGGTLVKVTIMDLTAILLRAKRSMTRVGRTGDESMEKFGMSAMIVFLNGNDAQSWVEYVQARPWRLEFDIEGDRKSSGATATLLQSPTYPISQRVQRLIEEGHTRVIEIKNIPSHVSKEQLADILRRDQSIALNEIEDITFVLRQGSADYVGKKVLLGAGKKDEVLAGMKDVSGEAKNEDLLDAKKDDSHRGTKNYSHKGTKDDLPEAKKGEGPEASHDGEPTENHSEAETVSANTRVQRPLSPSPFPPVKLKLRISTNPITIATVTFLSIEAASHAYHKLTRHGLFCEAQIHFLRDPCERPLGDCADIFQRVREEEREEEREEKEVELQRVREEEQEEKEAELQRVRKEEQEEKEAELQRRKEELPSRLDAGERAEEA